MPPADLCFSFTALSKLNTSEALLWFLCRFPALNLQVRSHPSSLCHMNGLESMRARSSPCMYVSNKQIGEEATALAHDSSPRRRDCEDHCVIAEPLKQQHAYRETREPCVCAHKTALILEALCVLWGLCFGKWSSLEKLSCLGGLFKLYVTTRLFPLPLYFLKDFPFLTSRWPCVKSLGHNQRINHKSFLNGFQNCRSAALLPLLWVWHSAKCSPNLRRCVSERHATWLS